MNVVLADPYWTTLVIVKLSPGVQTAPEVPVDWRRGGVDEDRGGEERAALGVELPEDGDQDDEEDDDGQLGAGPDEAGEEEWTGRGSEHVAVDLLPAVLVPEVPLHVVHLVLLAVPGVVLPQGPHEDHGDQPHEEDDHHEAVEDGEPVDPVLEEVGVEVLVEPVLIVPGGRLPDHFVGEGDGLAQLQSGPSLAGQVHVDDPVIVVSDLELLVGPDVVVLALLVRLPHDAPDGEVVHVHLVPVMVLH